MNFFLSGELDADVGELWRDVGKPLEKQLNEALGDRDYGPALKSIGLIPMILRAEFLFGRPERRLFQRKQHSADYRTVISFFAFKRGSPDTRRLLILENLVAAIRDLQRKAKGAFDGDRLIADILATFELSATDLASASSPGA